MQKLFICSLFLVTYFSLNLHAINLDDLSLEKGFNISIFAEDLDSPRQMVEGANGIIYVAERNGQIIALKDLDKNGQSDVKITLVKNLSLSTGISLYKGDLYFSEVSKIWKIKNIEDIINNYNLNGELPQRTLVLDKLPTDDWHGWKWLKHDKDGSLYLILVPHVIFVFPKTLNMLQF